MRWSQAARFLGVELGLGVVTTPALAKSPDGLIKQPQLVSTAQALNLSERLSRVGAYFYGAWSCPACVRQTWLLGKQAAARVPSVGCWMPEQRPREAAACRNAEVRAYPTWLLSEGQQREGVQSINKLSRWSGLD